MITCLHFGIIQEELQAKYMPYFVMLGHTICLYPSIVFRMSYAWDHNIQPFQIDCFCFSSVQFSSVAQSCLTLCDPMNCSTPGLPVHHQLLEFTQIHIHQVKRCHPAILSSVVPFSSCPQSLPASESFPMSQLFA